MKKFFTLFTGAVFAILPMLQATVVFAAAPTVTPVTIASNNANTAYAKDGDVITLSFTSDEYLSATDGYWSRVFATVGIDPRDMIFDSSGNLYVTNYGSGNVSKITPAGVSTIFANTVKGNHDLAIES